MRNRICDLFEVKYPIMQGAMRWLAVPELAAAVSKSGGLGTIAASASGSKDNLIKDIRKLRSLTDKPFVVNISLFPNRSNDDKIDEYIGAIIEEKVPIVETSGSSPEKYVKILKNEKIKLIHKVPSVKYAKKAESIGVDAISIVGYECGGHPGMSDTTSMILIPEASKVIKIPLIAGGGFADSKGFIAALALGADAIVMGTRFIASKECLIHNNFKDLIVNVHENDTIIIQKSIGMTFRVFKNDLANTVYEMEGRGATKEELMTAINRSITKECYASGNTEDCLFPIGQSISLIDKIKSVKEIIDDIVSDAVNISNRVNTTMKSL